MYTLYHDPLLKRRVMADRFLQLFIIIGIAFLVGHLFHTPIATYLFYGFCFIWALVAFFTHKSTKERSLRRTIKKAKKIGTVYSAGEIVCEFSEDSFVITMPDCESVSKYAAIEKIASGTDAFYLYVRVHSAHILPFRVFADDDERKAFLDFIQSKVNAPE